MFWYLNLLLNYQSVYSEVKNSLQVAREVKVKEAAKACILDGHS